MFNLPFEDAFVWQKGAFAEFRASSISLPRLIEEKRGVEPRTPETPSFESKTSPPKTLTATLAFGLDPVTIKSALPSSFPWIDPGTGCDQSSESMGLLDRPLSGLRSVTRGRAEGEQLIEGCRAEFDLADRSLDGALRDEGNRIWTGVGSTAKDCFGDRGGSID